MNTRILVPAGFLGLLAIGAARQLDAAGQSPQAVWAEAAREVTALGATQRPFAPGSFPATWINGVDCETEPDVQVHAYNEDTYIIRQSKCTTFEAPFLYLLFGEDRALLMDTGANPDAPVWEPVDGIVQDWLASRGRSTIDLVVAHTHHHFDHIQGDAQFEGKPFVDQIVAPTAEAFNAFWGFQNYPIDQRTIDLGGRVLDVIGTPGHHPRSVSLYDRNTHLLLTADLVYPGHLFVFSSFHWPEFVASLRRLVQFARQNPVEWVVGCHVEMGAAPFSLYPYGTTEHPDEHPLQLRPSILVDVLRESVKMGDDPQCKEFAEFAIHPVYLCGIGWNE